MTDLVNTRALMQVLLSIDSNLQEPSAYQNCERNIKFMTYELASLATSESDDEVYQTLTEFFFLNKKFQVCDGPFLISEILENRHGCGIAMSLVFMHFARCVDIELELVHWPLHTILKWDRNGKSVYVDLGSQGKILNEEEILSLLNKHKDPIQSLTDSEAIEQYLTYLSIFYRQNGLKEPLYKVLSYIVKLNPTNTRYLAERALLGCDIGHLKDSIADFKRYFSFIEKDKAPEEILTVYERTRNLEI